MAAPYTHNIYGKSVLQKLEKNTIVKLEKYIDYYNLFNQSFDNLFFYNFYMPIKGKKIRELGPYGHKNNVNLYFENIIKYLKDNYTDIGFAYLCGSINHYILDSHIHPFVFYKTGITKTNDKNYSKYNGMHAVLEFELDSFLYRATNKKSIRHIKSRNEIHRYLRFPKDLLDIIDYSFEKTFNVSNMGKIFNKAYLDSRLCYYLGFEDKYGFKKIIYKTIDKITGNKVKNISSHSMYKKAIDPSLFNLDKKVWNHPCDKSITYNYSILDLYEVAMKKSISIINNLDKYFNNKYDLTKLLKEIGNNSYVTGLDLSNNKKLKYFEY